MDLNNLDLENVEALLQVCIFLSHLCHSFDINFFRILSSDHQNFFKIFFYLRKMNDSE